MAEQEIESGGIENRIREIELRLSRIESALEISKDTSNYSGSIYIPAEPVLSELNIEEEGKGLESRIGRYGLSTIGNIVLFFGIAFFTQYLITQGQPLASAVIGYVSSLIIFLLAKYMKKTNISLAFMFKITGQVLLFFITMRLHFFSQTHLIQQKSLTILLLVLIIAYQIYWAIRNRSQTLSVISVVFAITIALVSDSTHLTLSIATIAAGTSVYYFHRFKWHTLVFITISLSYLAFFLWLFGNPLLGHKMGMISEHHSGILYLFLLGACYSSIHLFRQKNSSDDDFFIGVTFVNGIIFTVLLVLTVLKFFIHDYVSLFWVISLSCLAFSVLLHSRSDWNFATAYYSLYGFMAMSIALYGLFGYPDIYLILPVQSLLVVSMALWFRNRLIVVMNSLLFLGILLVYIISSETIDSANFSFAIISIISARIINWKTSRLKLETHIIRNLYLIEGFVMVMYALYNAIPKHFITLSWVMAALVYFILSILLKNVKYRYMALGTVICAALYLFLIDLARIEIIYRVMALLFLAAISIGISMYYSSRVSKEN